MILNDIRILFFRKIYNAVLLSQIMNYLYPIIAVIIVSLVTVVFALPLIFKKKVSQHTLLFLLSISVGVLLTTVFVDLLPESFAHSQGIDVAIYILIGFLIMFVLEKFIHWHHNKKKEDRDCGHSHAYSLAPINLIGDGIHNFIDGLVIAGAFAVNVAAGITATLSIIFHEIPQEIADFGVLLYSGMSKKKALAFNFLSATAAILGTILGLLLIQKVHGFTDFIIPFAAGSFLYIAASNLLPELHRHCGLKETFLHILAILIGIGIVLAVTILLPHTH